jgi:hypothetical protein
MSPVIELVSLVSRARLEPRERRGLTPDVVYLDALPCKKCGRRGQYYKHTLMKRYGPDIRLPDLLAEITQCPRLSALGQKQTYAVQNPQ